MSGEELYARYVELNEQLLNCGVDEWDLLSSDDQRVWNRLAEGLAHKELG